MFYLQDKKSSAHLKHFLKWLYKCTKKDKMNNRKLHGMKKENIMKQNKVIQIAIFGVIFLISLFIWNYTLVGRNNQGVTETQQPTFPLLTISVDGKDINELHGYQGDVDASLIRDSITPVYENQVKVILKDATEDISVVSYKLYDTDNKTVLGNGDTAFHKGKENVRTPDKGV